MENILNSLFGGVAFGFGAMIGVSICWFCVTMVSRDAKIKQQEFNEEAMAHWKKLDNHWEVIANYVTKLDKD